MKNNFTSRKTEPWVIERLRQLSFMDNELFTRAFRERPDLAEHLLRGLLSMPGLKVVKSTTQDRIYDKNSKSVILDCLCTDSEGNLYNIEVQNDVSKSLGRRARAYGSIFEASQEYEELPERYIIFITREDFLKNGRQVTVLAMRDEEGKSEDESGMYHVYGCINNRDENTEAGRVLSDMSCTRAEGMYYDGYRERMEDFKVRKEGVREMTGVLEQIMNEGLEKGMRKGMKKGVKQGMQQGIASRNAEIIANMSALGFSIEQIVQVTGLSAKEVTEIARLGKN